MAVHARSVGWVRAHSPGRRGRPLSALIAAGVVLLVAGAALGFTALSPMFSARVPEDPSLINSLSRPDSAAVTVMPPGNAIGSAPSLIPDGPANGVAFVIEIPVLKYHATVLEGVGKTQLDRGPGHYPESAWPGHPGNVAVAAHNVYWLSFNRLQPGDHVIIRTRYYTFVYEVANSRVVEPADRSPLEQSAEHRLTLTTCYPLWAGAAATKRLIFTAREVGGVA